MIGFQETVHSPELMGLSANSFTLFMRCNFFAAMLFQTEPFRLNRTQIYSQRFGLVRYDEYGGNCAGTSTKVTSTN